jgi:hypothetical protein
MLTTQAYLDRMNDALGATKCRLDGFTDIVVNPDR